MTPHWTEQRVALREALRTNPRFLIACDFDGTLAPLVAHADDARLPANTRAVLLRLLSAAGVTLAFISGRSLEDLRQRIGLSGALYAGNHGLEMVGADGAAVLISEAEERRPAMLDVLSVLRPLLQTMPGVWIEDKGLTLAVHYRLAAESLRPAIERAVRLSVAPGQPLVIRPAKCIWEIRPDIGWDKGSALHLFMQQLQVPPCATAYLGDDSTDYDAIRKLPDGWTFFVGENAGPPARVALRDVQDTTALLEWMADVREEML